MRIKKLNKTIIIISIIVLLFGVYNLMWFQLTKSKYRNYINGMDEFRKNVSYVQNNGDGYLYNVKFPEYPTYTGNLAIATRDNKYSLIIWPNIFNNDFKYGVQIENENNEVISIRVDENMDSINEYDKEMTDKNKEILNELYYISKNKWFFSE
jgi:hypothetical protein